MLASIPLIGGRTLFAIILGYSALSYLVAYLGKKRKIGFGLTYFLSMLLTPVVGLIAAFASKKEPNTNERRDVIFTTLGCILVFILVGIVWVLSMGL